MYLTNKYYDNAEIRDCGGDHDGWILNTLLRQSQMWSKTTKVEQNNKR